MIATRLPFSTVGCFLLAACLTLSAWAQPVAAFELPPVQQGSNIDDCAAKLNDQGGGWCEIRHGDGAPSISAVWPRNLDKKTNMIVGPKAVLIAWNGAAFDQENLLLYFTGGGHADYGGNEVYEFNLKTGAWSRLTDPSPLDFLYVFRAASSSKPARYCWAPDLRRVPGSTHTYDGLQFSKATHTIFLLNMGAANGACFNDKDARFKDDDRILAGMGNGAGIYEFNPSRKEERNGLAPLTWRRLANTEGHRLSYPRSVELPDGRMIIGDSVTLYSFDPTAGAIGKRLWQIADYGDGIAAYHPSDMILSLHGGVLLVSSLRAAVSQKLSLPGFGGQSLAIDDTGKIFTWDGTSRVMSLDLGAKDKSWQLFDWSAAGPKVGNHSVYSKWQYVPGYKMFVGISTEATGVWLYKHPENMPASDLAKANPQAMIDRAKPGTTVTIPPGLYGQGLFINKSLTVKLKDVRLWGVAQRKGILNVNCDGCKVVVEDFHGEGRNAGCITGNCAGIKAEGIDFDLTVRRADIDNTVMGILTDNRGGRLVVEDSLIENTGLNDRTNTLGHGLYAGKIDELTVRRTTIRNVNGDGHILKSRARLTTLEATKLLGDRGFHSRSIDLSCGGTLRITDSVVQQSENTDNPDVIAVGTEARICQGDRPSDVSITNSVIIINRDRSADERARNYGPNFLFRWRAPLKAVEVKDNRIVNLERWSTTNASKGDVTIPDFSDRNKMCETTAACGLSADGS